MTTEHAGETGGTATAVPAVLEAVPLPGGALRTLRVPAFGDPQRPVALLLHGALGSLGVLVPALSPFAAGFEPVLVDLPGHGGSPPPARLDLDGFAERVAALVEARFAGRRVLLIGESFGGLVALATAALGAPVEAVVAVDPPLSTAKQWHVGAAFRMYGAANPDDRFAPAFGRALFGIGEEPHLIAERLYYPVLAAGGRPVLLVTGDVPLGQPRPTTGVPCCLDAVDEYIVASAFASGVKLVRVAGAGHVVLRDNPAAVYAASRAFWDSVVRGTPAAVPPAAG